MKKDVGRKDVVGGALVAGIGAATTAYATLGLHLGTPMRMGPGMFPAGLGVLLIGLGALIALPALKASGELPKIAWRPLLSVLGAITAFAIVVPYGGVIAAIAALVIVSSFAGEKVTVLSGLGVWALMSALIVALIIFVKLPIKIFPW